MKNKEIDKIKFHIRTINNIISSKEKINFLQNIIDFDLSKEDVKIISNIFIKNDDIQEIIIKIKKHKIDINENMIKTLYKSFKE